MDRLSAQRQSAWPEATTVDPLVPERRGSEDEPDWLREATTLLTGQLAGGQNDWFASAAGREGTLFADRLLRGGKMAQAYMKRNASPPELVAEAALAAVHDPIPRQRYTCGMSLEMRLAALTPQWLLDIAAAKM